MAAMILTSTACPRTAPSRRTHFSSMAFRNLLWSARGRASISSKNNVPPDAASSRPGLARLASVNVPASKPKSSASNSVSGMAAQLTSMNGPWARGPLSWITRATSPLPVPVSPWRSTVGACGLPTVSKVAKCRICARRALIAGERPRRRSVGWPAGEGLGCAIGISLSVLGGRTTTAIPVGQAGHGDGYTWLKMAKTGCDWLRDSSGFPCRGQGGEAQVPRMHGLTADGMGIAQAPNRHHRGRR